MKVAVVYRERSDYRRDVETYLGDFERRTGKEVEVIDPDSRRGIEFCRVYDIVEYPTMIAMADNGSMLMMWRGLPLPTIDEVSYYVR